MELIDFFKAIGWRFWVLLALPIATALVPVVIVFGGPTQYAVTATVNGSAFVTAAKTGYQFSGFGSGTVFAADFAAAAKQKVITDQVAAQTGLKASAIANGLTSAEVGTSSNVNIIFTSSHKRTNAKVVNLVATDTLNWLFQSQVTDSALPGDKATAVAADAALATFVSDYHTANPSADYLIKARALAQLEEAEVQDQALSHYYTLTSQAPAQLQPKASAALGARSTTYAKRVVVELAQIAKLKSELAALTPLVPQYEALRQEQSIARAEVSRASAPYQKALRQENAANPGSIIRLSKPRTAFSTSKFLKTDAGAGGGALAVALIFLAIWEIVSRQRRQRRLETAAEADPATAPVAA